MGRGGPERAGGRRRRRRPGRRRRPARPLPGRARTRRRTILEDAALAGVATVGRAQVRHRASPGPRFCRTSPRRWRLARALDPDLVLLEGSGAALPPVAADRTVLVTSAARPAESLVTGMGPYRILVSDMLVVITMCEPPLADRARTSTACARPSPAIRPDLPVVDDGASGRARRSRSPASGSRSSRRRRPSGPRRRCAPSLEAEHGAEVVGRGRGRSRDRAALARRPRLARRGRAAATYLTEIKAAAIDVVAEAAPRRAARGWSSATTGRRSIAGSSPTWTPRCVGLADEVVAARA